MVEVKKMGSLFAANLVEVIPHIGRKSLTISVPKEVTELRRVGKKSLGEDEKVFVQDNVASGRIEFMPVQSRELMSIENRGRNICRRSILVQSYMLYDTYRTVQDEFEEARKSYFDKRDEVSLNWDREYYRFSMNLMDYLRSSMDYEMVDQIEDPVQAAETRAALDERVQTMHTNLISQLPSKEEWRDSFLFNLEVREYPAAPGSLPGLSEKWEERTEALAENLISHQVEDLFDSVNKLLKAMNGRKSYTVQLNSVRKAAGSILNYKIFDDPALNSLAERMVKIGDYAGYVDALAEESEGIMADIIRFAEGHKIYLDLKSMPVSREYLLS